MHLFFGQMVRAPDPAVGGNAVGHTGIYLMAAVVLPQPFDIVIVRAPGSIGQLHVVKAVALAMGG